MAAAHAAVVSLLNTMDQIQTHPRLSTSIDYYQNASLREMVDFFLDFVENHSNPDSKEAEDLMRGIADLAHVAEDIINVHAAIRIRAASTQQSPSFLPDLQMIIEGMDHIKEKIFMPLTYSMQPTYSVPVPPPSSSAPPATTKTAMVGFDGYLAQLLDELIGLHSGRRIIPIVGMGGIGKTTLARNVYQNSLILDHFYVCAWVTVSQEFSAKKILLQALSCTGGTTSKTDRSRTDHNQLVEELRKVLYDRRYLIVLDDVWSVEDWEKIKLFFPDNNNGSRLVVTTRQQELVHHFGSSALVVKFLDDKNSWELFCEKIFAHQGCPPELEEISKTIVKKCKGLPLAITVVGGLLGKWPRMREYWKIIAEDRSLILDSVEGDIKPWSILNLSYKQLPVWLKSCFLYMGLFPEDYEIYVPELIKLWIAEGFIKPNTEQSLEEVAESYINDLVDRNLLLVRRLRLNGKMETCCVHDLVRELCIRIAERENFYCAQRDIDGMRHFIVDERAARSYRRDSHTCETPSLVSPLIFHGQRRGPFKSRLLRVLYRVDMCPLDYAFREANLRCIYHSCDTCKFPSSMSLLWSLQTLIITGIDTFVGVVAPPEIWKMRQLRHIEMSSICLPDPPPSDEQDDVFVLQNLQTLKTVHNLIFTEEVCKRIPNIKDLRIHYHFLEPIGRSPCCHMQNVGCLNKLESLHYSCHLFNCHVNSLQNLKLPSSLKELILWGCKLEWSDMTMIGWLPHLEYLELGYRAVVGAEWICVEEEFLSLKYLRIWSCDDLINWTASISSFGVLKSLSLSGLHKLHEIPSSIGEIETLETVSMHNCSQSACMSAVEIVAEQEGFGNQDLHLQVTFHSESEAEMLKEEMKARELTCQYLVIKGSFARPDMFD